MRDKKPLVTVYITNYNYGRYIRQAIESVLNQTMQDFELLIIDDGSKDNSRDIIEEYAADTRVSIIYQENRGLNITNNVALKASQGKYIVRLDADDFLELDALKRMSDILEEDPELGLVFPNYYIIDASGNTVSEIKRHDFSTEVNILDQPAHGACTMIRVDYLKDVGGYDETYTCQDGYELWVKFISKYKVTNTANTLFSYRRHSNNLTNNEEKILGTRSKIKQAFVLKNKVLLPKTAAVLPIRSQYNVPMEKFHSSSFLERKIGNLLRAGNITKVIVTSSDSVIKKEVQDNYDASQVLFVDRPSQFERINVSLFKTLEFLAQGNHLSNMEACLFCSVAFPFVDEEILNDAINTLAIFKADSLITVRPESNKFYRHTGDGMQTILGQDKFTKFEREAIYRYSGGVLLAQIGSSLKAGKLVHGKVGHVVISEKAALNAESDFERQVCNSLIAGEKVEKLY